MIRRRLGHTVKDCWSESKRFQSSNFRQPQTEPSCATGPLFAISPSIPIGSGHLLAGVPHCEGVRWLSGAASTTQPGGKQPDLGVFAPPSCAAIQASLLKVAVFLPSGIQQGGISETVVARCNLERDFGPDGGGAGSSCPVDPQSKPGPVGEQRARPLATSGVRTREVVA